MDLGHRDSPRDDLRSADGAGPGSVSGAAHLPAGGRGDGSEPAGLGIGDRFLRREDADNQRQIRRAELAGDRRAPVSRDTGSARTECLRSHRFKGRPWHRGRQAAADQFAGGRPAKRLVLHSDSHRSKSGRTCSWLVVEIGSAVMPRTRVSATLGAAGLMYLGLLVSAQQPGRTGSFSASQSTAGKAAYERSCADCHKNSVWR